MTYYLYNCSAATVTLSDIGLEILVSENFEIDQNDIDDGLLYAGGDLEASINAGNLVLTTDATIPPLTQYTIAEAIERLSLEEWAREVNYDDTITGFGEVNVQKAIEAIKVALQASPQQSVHVAKNGTDVVGNGSFLYPYLTITYANSQITDAAYGKRYTIFVYSGTYNETVVLNPYVSLIAAPGEKDVGLTSNSPSPGISWSSSSYDVLSGLYIYNNGGPIIDIYRGFHVIYNCELYMISSVINNLCTFDGAIVYFFNNYGRYYVWQSVAGINEQSAFELKGRSLIYFNNNRFDMWTRDPDDNASMWLDRCRNGSEIYIHDNMCVIKQAAFPSNAKSSMLKSIDSYAKKEFANNMLEVYYYSTGGSAVAYLAWNENQQTSTATINSINNDFYGKNADRVFNAHVDLVTDYVNSFFDVIRTDTVGEMPGTEGPGVVKRIIANQDAYLALTDGVKVNKILDEDNMASDDNEAIATQQSIKAYVDSTAGVGEANTASNIGVGGVGVFKQKTGVDLEFKNINTNSTAITVMGDILNDEIDIGLAVGNIDHNSLLNAHNLTTDIDHDLITNTHNLTTDIDHTLIQNVGVNTHAQIDTHISDGTIHFTEASIDHTLIQNIGTNTHAQIDTHIANTLIHIDWTNATQDFLTTGDAIIGHNFASPYTLSIQTNTTQTWLEILNNGGANQGVFFGIWNDDFDMWNYQAGHIRFYTDTIITSGVLRMLIKDTGIVQIIGLSAGIMQTDATGNISSSTVSHSDLTGLGADDHLQYLTEVRHDALAFDNPHSINLNQGYDGFSATPSQVVIDNAEGQGNALDYRIQDATVWKVSNTQDDILYVMSDMATAGAAFGRTYCEDDTVLKLPEMGATPTGHNLPGDAFHITLKGINYSYDSTRLKFLSFETMTLGWADSSFLTSWRWLKLWGDTSVAMANGFTVPHDTTVVYFSIDEIANTSRPFQVVLIINGGASMTLVPGTLVNGSWYSNTLDIDLNEGDRLSWVLRYQTTSGAGTPGEVAIVTYIKWRA